MTGRLVSEAELCVQRIRKAAQRQQLESRIDELDRLATSQAEITATAADAMHFLSSLEFTLRQGLPQEKLTVLRQCIERVHIDKQENTATLSIRPIPCANLESVKRIDVTIQPEQ